MKNLEQIRSKNAYQAAQEGPFNAKNGGEVVKKIPTMIIENGILPTIAYALEKNDKGEYKNKDVKKAFDKIFRHLSELKVAKMEAAQKLNYDTEKIQERILSQDTFTASNLREVTTETMAFLNYFRRYAGKQSPDLEK